MKRAVLLGIVVLSVVSLSCVGVALCRYWHHPDVVMASLRNEDVQKQRREAEMELAFQSMDDRLPKGRPIKGPEELSGESKEFWDTINSSVAAEHRSRAEVLQAFHEKTRQFFVESEGFGVGRLKGFLPPEHQLLGYFAKLPAEKQPGLPAYFPVSPGETLETVPANVEFLDFHRKGTLRFVNAEGFGFMQNRRQVSGFIPHGFGAADRYGFGILPDGTQTRYRIDHILLVGLLMHEQPVVYLSDDLPSMKTARTSPTRPLDAFEGSGLEILVRGGDLHITQKGGELRMLGALRATTQCLACHDAESGDLLGAFSYTLRGRLVKESP